MNPNVPYMLSISNLPKILDAIQRAGAPTVFNLDFLKDLGFSSSNDRPVIKILKYLGMLNDAGHPQGAYREFMDHSKGKRVLASRLMVAFDDLFTADRNAHGKSVDSLKGWFKTKTGSSDSVAQKIATTFKALAQYGDFSVAHETAAGDGQKKDREAELKITTEKPREQVVSQVGGKGVALVGKEGFGLVYRFEIHLPDTQNVETFRAIFKALREELM